MLMFTGVDKHTHFKKFCLMKLLETKKQKTCAVVNSTEKTFTLIVQNLLPILTSC